MQSIVSNENEDRINNNNNNTRYKVVMFFFVVWQLLIAATSISALYFSFSGIFWCQPINISELMIQFVLVSFGFITLLVQTVSIIALYFKNHNIQQFVLWLWNIPNCLLFSIFFVLLGLQQFCNPSLLIFECFLAFFWVVHIGTGVLYSLHRIYWRR